MPSLLERPRDFFDIGRPIILGAADFWSSMETGIPSTVVKRVITTQAAKSGVSRAILNERSPKGACILYE